eukprot:11219058-Lingulodinium_polyedra.AAC.1
MALGARRTCCPGRLSSAWRGGSGVVLLHCGRSPFHDRTRRASAAALRRGGAGTLPCASAPCGSRGAG